MANYGGFGPPQTGFNQPGGYPPQQPGGFPPQQPGGYPPSGGFPTQQPGGYPPQQPGGFPPQQPGGYPPQQPGGYPPQQPGGYPPQQSGGYPPQQPGFGGPTAVDPNIYQWFQTVDADKTGKINATELQRALTNANWTKFNFETCRLMIAMFDRDGSKQIDFTGFQGLWAYIHQWKGIFDQFDRDRSGFIDANELSNALNQMGLRVQPQLCQGIVTKYDHLNGQKLSLDNFIQVSVLLKSMTDQFKVRDPGSQGSIQIRYDDFLNAVILNKF